jgi:hypothetical protein
MHQKRAILKLNLEQFGLPLCISTGQKAVMIPLRNKRLSWNFIPIKLNYNAVIVQIRSVGDAFYPSKLAPWSKYLTGKEGQAPTLLRPIGMDDCRSSYRGFEFHILNPYRATMDCKNRYFKPTMIYKHRNGWLNMVGNITTLPCLKSRII